jgi:hypothetical protein
VHGTFRAKVVAVTSRKGRNRVRELNRTCLDPSRAVVFLKLNGQNGGVPLELAALIDIVCVVSIENWPVENGDNSMRVLTLLLVTLLRFIPVAGAQEKQAPTGQPPRLWLASASKQDGKVIIQIAEPVERGGTDLARGLGPGVGSLPATTVTKWSNFPKVTLGKTVQVLRVDGKSAEEDTVLKTLAKPKGVAVFVRAKDGDPTKPDPFYLALLREDTVVLVVNQKDIYPQEP